MSTLGEKIANQVANDIRDFFNCLCDAQVQHSMGGLGGCKHFEAEAFPAKFRPYITRYLETGADSAQCLVEYLQDNGYIHGARPATLVEIDLVEVEARVCEQIAPKEITFDMVCRDDCLNTLVPSDLRRLVKERDSLKTRVAELEAEKARPTPTTGNEK